MQTYAIGEPRQLTSHWYDSDGAATEPSAITLTVTHPDGTVDTHTKVPDLTQGDTTADWFLWITPDANGLWRFLFVGTVDGFDVEQGGRFLVGSGSSTSPSGPCEPWTTWEDVEACGPTSITTLSAEARELVIDQASEILFNLSGRFYSGACEVTRSLCFGCQTCYPSCCDCAPLGSIDLGPMVWGVWDVYVDGVVLDPSEYKLVGNRWLVRIGGSWPSGRDVADPSAFRASWAVGQPIPGGARRAAQLFAVEIAKLCARDQTCALPQRVTTVSREGITYTILDPMKIIQEGRTGITLVDLWLVADAQGRRSLPRLFSPAARGMKMVR